MVRKISQMCTLPRIHTNQISVSKRVYRASRELFARASFLIGLLIGRGHKQGD